MSLRRLLPLCLLLLLGCPSEPEPAPEPTVAPVAQVGPDRAEAVSAAPQERLAAVEALGAQPRLVRSWAAGDVSALELGIQGGVALVGTRAGEVTVWQLPEAWLERRWQGAPGGALGPVVGVGQWWSHVWAVFDIEGELWLVDLVDDRLADRVPTPAAGVERVLFPRDSEQLLVQLGDGFAGWTPPQGALVPLETPPAALDPALERQRWQDAGITPELPLSTRSGTSLAVAALGAGTARLSADGRTLVGLHDDRLGLWDLQAARGLDPWEGQGSVLRLRFAVHDLLVAVDRGSQGVELRDAATGLLLGPLEQVAPGWDPFAVEAEPTAFSSLPGVAVAALSSDGRWLLSADESGSLRRWDLDALRQGRILDTRLDRMLRAAPYSADTLLARAEVAALAGRWGKVADQLELAERQGAAIHPARRLRALSLAGRAAGARELLERVGPSFADDPAVRAWAHWLGTRPAR